jgi:hypothetical protein
MLVPDHVQAFAIDDTNITVIFAANRRRSVCNDELMPNMIINLPYHLPPQAT